MRDELVHGPMLALGAIFDEQIEDTLEPTNGQLGCRSPTVRPPRTPAPQTSSATLSHR